MENINFIVANSLVGSFIVLFIYFYIYKLYRENYILIWATAWTILLTRYVLFDTGVIPWQNFLVYIVMYQFLIICSAFLFLWGSYVFIGKSNKQNLCIKIFIIITGITLSIDLLSNSLTYQLLVPLIIGSGIGLWTGYIYISSHHLYGIGHLIIGYACILWNLLNLLMPVTIESTWFNPIGYSIGGTLRLAIGIGTLVAYFEKNRNELIHKEQEYRMLAENAVDVIYSYQTNPNLKIKYVSPAVLTLIGYRPEDFYHNQKFIYSLIHPDDQLKFKRFIVTLSPQSENILIFRLIHKNQNTIWAELKCAPIYDDIGIIEWTGVIRDISTRKKLEDIAVAYERMNMVGNMAATVAHEIRNPMTTVHGYLQVLSNKERYQNDHDKFKLMIEELERANSIISQYLSLSRQKFSNLKKSSLNDIIHKVFPLIEATANNSKISIDLALDEIPPILLDENEIRQLLLNIVRNGIEAMVHGGNLFIITTKLNQEVILSIQDQGPGISEEVLNRIGTPFMTTKENGTGLGMALCYQIAKRHHATITIDTGKQGTTFHIKFPVIKEI